LKIIFYAISSFLSGMIGFVLLAEVYRNYILKGLDFVVENDLGNLIIGIILFAFFIVINIIVYSKKKQ
jgi:hypothetical protein